MLLVLNALLAPVVLVLLFSFARMLADATGSQKVGPSHPHQKLFHP